MEMLCFIHFSEILIKLDSLKPNVGECSLWNITTVSTFQPILFWETNIKRAYFTLQPSLTS